MFRSQQRREHRIDARNRIGNPPPFHQVEAQDRIGNPPSESSSEALNRTETLHPSAASKTGF
ncbi:hypothetical protein B5G09_05650 [Alistipes sp. An54]|nr:hypothetical protein B5G09_05650 [Alistipes sp. An54]